MMSLRVRWQELRKKRWVRWVLDAALVLAIIGGVGAWQSRNLPSGPAPAFSLRALDGATVDNSTLRGKPTLIVFWAPWCGVCKAESPNISWLKRAVGDRAHVLSVASDYDGLSAVQRYVDDRGVDYPVLLGGTRTAREWGVRAFPSIFFLDGDGNIDHAVVGYSTTAGLLWRLFL